MPKAKRKPLGKSVKRVARANRTPLSPPRKGPRKPLTPVARNLLATELIAKSLASLAQTARDFHSIMYPIAEDVPDAEIYHRGDQRPASSPGQASDPVAAEDHSSGPGPGAGKFERLIRDARKAQPL